MKLIFLDIDGVLNSSDTMRSRHALLRSKHEVESIPYDDLKYLIRDEYGHLFDENAVRFLAALVTKFDAKIVISSTWRYAGLKTMQEMWKKRNLPGEVIGITPDMNYPIEDETYGDMYRTTARGFEIHQFMRDIQKGTVPETHCIIREQQEIESYVIFDDDRDMLPFQMQNFVQVDHHTGLSYNEYSKAEAILINTCKYS